MFATAAAIVSALVATAALFEHWQKRREAALRSEEVLAWANEVICALQSLYIICTLDKSRLETADEEEKLADIIFNTSILVERGRLFFKNVESGDYGRDKQPAYRGLRPTILDQIVIAHQVACEWAVADEDRRLRMRLLAEGCVKRFVSLAQREVGRDRTAAAETKQAGDGVHLDDLLDAVDDNRLARLRGAEGGGKRS